MEQKAAPVFLLTGRDLGLAKKLDNAISRSLSSFGIVPDQIGSFELSEEQLVEIASNIRAVKLSPEKCAQKLRNIMARRHFSLLRTIDDKVLTWNIFRSDAGDFAGFPTIFPITDNSAASVLSKMSESDNIPAETIAEIRKSLKIESYSYLQITARHRILLCLKICEAVESLLNENENTEQKNSKALQKLTAIKPQKAIIPHTIVANNITAPDPWYSMTKIGDRPRYSLSDGPAKTYFALSSVIGEEGLTTNRRLTLYDKSVLNSCITLYAAGNEVISARQIAAVMKGIQDDGGIDEATVEKVKKSIEKQRFTEATIDATESFEERGIKGVPAIFGTYLLPLDIIKVNICGQVKDAYCFIKEPPVLTHARIIRQIYSVPMIYLQTGTLSATDTVVALRDYLITRIEAAKDKKLSPKILYSTLYALMGISEPSIYDYGSPYDEAHKRDLSLYKQETKKIRDRAKGLMENWIAQGYIEGYMEIKRGRAFEAIQIRI